MKTQNPIIGRSRGSAGGMTFCKVYDKNVARAKAFEVSNPNTPAQQTQRDFFKQVADIVRTVSDEQLRSLFGSKPKAMSRRNALSKQVSAANSIDGSSKAVDFSKLLAIGSGPKVTTPFMTLDDGELIFGEAITLDMFGSGATVNTNVVVVAFDERTNAIKIENLQTTIDDLLSIESLEVASLSGCNGYAYFTCSTDGDDISALPFGSFTLKTRMEKPAQPQPVPTGPVTVYAGGLDQGSFFHFTDSRIGDDSSDANLELQQGGIAISGILRWDEVNNWWYSNFNIGIRDTNDITLAGTIGGRPIEPFDVEIVVQ